MKISFIGLGRMGSGLAKNLIRNGFGVHLYDIREEAITSITSAIGGKQAHNVSEAVTDADVVFTSVPLPADLESLLLGDGGVMTYMKQGSTVIDVSTIDPLTARRLSDIAAVRGIQYLECPLGKGPKQAEEGTEPIFAGGRKEVFEQHRAMLEKIGTPVYYLGDVEQSTAFKIISNLIGMTNMAILAEGLRLGERAGIDARLLHGLLAETGADSYQLRLRGPWLLEEDYAPRFSINLTVKDLRLGVEMAKAWSHPAEFSKLALKYFEISQAEGYGEEDTNAVYKVIRHVLN
ncbi:NAD(P)-dependent oxidoreductase [Alicyclobacillus dauci]|uniref:NAD(P)-dependent oxidoreductase n=1 Tax=Alicyclobacillus dauci TaxID=1475485 RepID=A0ABY6YXP7_9BACL|nr:NAD(P)-dependent oxidoreductase [Alicyclobacillus dauci]WAH35184.1 NAD(P)-dependent oxidoreductase [Alicyclobacillus dauci]